MGLNEQLQEVKLKIKEKQRLLSLLAKVQKQQSDLEAKKQNLYNKLKQEKLDVEKLEGTSLSHLLHLILGDSSQALEKEQQEAISAKLKYDEACKELDNLSSETENLKNKLIQYKDLEEIYSDLLREKEEFIKFHNSEVLNRLNQIMDEEVNSKGMIKEIDEALTAGQDLKNGLSNAHESLKSAKNWGVWDMFGGDFISTAIKHSRIDDAQAEISGVQSLLRRFERELQDVDYTSDLKIEIGSFLSFADFFFDGIFVDWAVQSRIEDALSRVENTLYGVSNIIEKLRNDKQNLLEKLESLERQRLDTIENS